MTREDCKKIGIYIVYYPLIYKAYLHLKIILDFLTNIRIILLMAHRHTPTAGE